MDSFFPKHVIFQPENITGIMSHDIERLCKIYIKENGLMA